MKLLNFFISQFLSSRPRIKEVTTPRIFLSLNSTELSRAHVSVLQPLLDLGTYKIVRGFRLAYKRGGWLIVVLPLRKDRVATN